ncbi:hypothetical protein ES332_A11G127200v1 [Gossypium tomentosum]|uniref:Uncharacterized protein n=1 Tax=Gossypium tomentosum TaxID=34277 RepID=A0A5D2N9K0_GOSTO|nr:hypothetical protein ES332_A11G127200v1 [Gossypium tomentosum]
MEMPPIFKSITCYISTSDSSKLQSEVEIYLFGGCITSWKDMVLQWWKVTEEESQ